MNIFWNHTLSHYDFITNMRTYCKETQKSSVKGDISNSFCRKAQTVTLPMKFELYIRVVIELQWNLDLFRGHPQDQGKCPLKRGVP